MDVQLIAIVAILIALVALWRTKSARPKTKFLKALLRDRPIKPNHRAPKRIGESYGDSILVSDEDRQFFKDFENFGSVVNWWLADEHSREPWRLQELPETELKIGFSDTPRFGRRYDIFHNQVRLGTLEIKTGARYTKNRNVSADVELQFTRLLPFNGVAGFLSVLAMHVCDVDRSSKSYQEAQQNISFALSRALWDAKLISDVDIGEGWGDLELRLAGSADWYFIRREALYQQQDGSR